MADASDLNARLATYRRGFDRVFFGVALLGAFVAVHLLIQQGRGFDRGCLGFSDPAAAAQAATFNCELVTQSGAGTLLGLSNAWWGLGFYLAVAALSAGAAFAVRPRFRLAGARAVLVSGGLLYSGYLTYHQFAGLGALCALCLTSAAIALVLFVVQAALLLRVPVSSPPSTASSMTVARSPVRWAGAVLALLVLAGADVAYFSNLETARAATGSETTQARGAGAEAAAQAPGAARGAEEAGAEDAASPPARSASAADTTEDAASRALPAGCRYAPDAQTVPLSRLVAFSDPAVGAADAPVTVVEFFDPNCPHCKTFHNTMKGLKAQYGDEVRFVYKPIWLWQRSINQIAALHAAQQQGQFMEMLDAQFANQQRGGLSNDQLARIAREIGMNPDAMLSQIRDNAYRQKMTRDRQVAQESGVRGTPAVSINGKLLGRRSSSAQCVSAMIEQKLAQEDA